jgi:molybdate transport system substrate-binding protein
MSKKIANYYPVFFPFCLLCFLWSCQKNEEDNLLIFAGSASQPALEEFSKLFEEKMGAKVEIVFGSSGQVLNQMSLSKQGDIYFAGSSDYMEIAKNKKLVFPQSEKRVCYLVPSINVQKGNPKNIHSLKDLLNPNLKIAIANPEGVCVGVYAIEIIENSFKESEKEEFRNNLINYLGSCSKTATAISLKSVDVVLGWRVFEDWDSENIETIPLEKSQIVRVAYVPIAISKFTKNKTLAKQFIDLLSSEAGKNIFKKYHYLTSEQEVFSYIGQEKPIGGVYTVPQNWLAK